MDKKRILYVEDDTLLRKLHSESSKSDANWNKEWELSTSRSIKEVKRRFENGERWDVAVVDLGIEGPDSKKYLYSGFDLVEYLLGEGIPCAILTGHTGIDEQRTADRLGVKIYDRINEGHLTRIADITECLYYEQQRVKYNSKER